MQVILLSETTYAFKVGPRVLFLVVASQIIFAVTIIVKSTYMNSTHENSPSREVREIACQISALEEQFAELFVKGSSRDLLRRIHLQLMVLKTELQLMNNRCL